MHHDVFQLINPVGVPVPEKNPQNQVHEVDLEAEQAKSDREDLKARNRKAAKKWRDKKDTTLHQLAATNDNLRQEAMKLRNESLSLIAENRVLESELHFFQIFMTKIMGSSQKK